LKKRCRHERVDLVRDLRSLVDVSQCRYCGKVWKDKGKKYHQKIKMKGDET
jgi:Zn-finger nucleic acid-binding protein